MAEIARFCRSQWDQISYDRDPATIDDATTVREYFHRRPEDRIHSYTIPIQPDTTTDVNALEIGRHLTLTDATAHVPSTPGNRRHPEPEDPPCASPTSSPRTALSTPTRQREQPRAVAAR